MFNKVVIFFYLGDVNYFGNYNLYIYVLYFEIVLVDFRKY